VIGSSETAVFYTRRSPTISAGAHRSRTPHGELIVAAAREHDIDPALLQAIISIESADNPNARSFNTDGNGGIPQIVNTMLLFSRPGRIDLLPALPAEWPRGEICGILARGSITINRLAWDTANRTVRVSFTSRTDQTVKVRLYDKEQLLHFVRDEPVETEMKW